MKEKSLDSVRREFIKNDLVQNRGLFNKGRLKKSYSQVATRYGVTEQDIRSIISEYNNPFKENTNPVDKKTPYVGKVRNNSKQDMNILVVGDLHAPFILDGYLEWCKEIGEQYGCNHTVLIGDVIDGHSWSYHEQDVDGYSVGHELEAAIKQLQLAYKLFPEADLTLGNHDLLIARKARTAGLSKRFIKDFKDVIEAPEGWNIAHEFVYDGVRYTHGTTGNAFSRAKESRISTVQGHLHSQAFVEYSVSEKDALFGLQIGCGIDHNKYAFEYAKPLTKKPIVSCGVVLDNGSVPLVRLMPL